MKIYILAEDPYGEGLTIHGVYSTREKAMEAIPHFKVSLNEENIEEHDVDPENGPNIYEDFFEAHEPYDGDYPLGNVASIRMLPSQLEVFGREKNHQGFFQIVAFGRTKEEAAQRAKEIYEKEKPMTTDIFIRTYSKDLPWLAYLLKSIKKYCSGFGNIIVVAPEQDKKAIEGFNLTLEKVFYVKESGKPDTYLEQQISKVYADKYSQAGRILFVDSDCCFNTDTTPESFLFDDKPVMLITPYHELGKAVPWKPITEKALQFECPFETMRRLPWIYPRTLLPLFREYMAKIHGKPVEEYIMEQPHHAFSEFNAMGSFAHQFHPDAFHYIETNKQALPPTVLKQNWSWGGITPEIRKELEEMTR